MVMGKRRMVRKTITMEVEDLAVVRQVAKDCGHGSISGGLRYIVRDWKRMQQEERRRLAPNMDEGF